MDQPVDTVKGVGPKTAEYLHSINIKTVGELSVLPSYGQSSRVQDLITRAGTILGVASKDTNVEKKLLQNNQHKRYFTQAHSWWEIRVEIFDANTQEMKSAVIYELCIKPHTRCVFLCNWLSTDGILCKSAFSPQYLKYYNTDLPELTLRLSKRDISMLPNIHCIDETLSETNMMITENKQTCL
jgi:hypothetical protein